MRLLAGSLDDEVDGLVALLVRAVHIVLAGHDGVEDDADDGADGQTGEADGAELEAAGGRIADADGQNQDQGRDSLKSFENILYFCSCNTPFYLL